MKVLKFPTVVITFFFALGILVANYFKPDTDFIFLFSSISILAIILLFIFSKRNKKIQLFFGIGTYLVTFILGVLVFSLHYPVNHSNHYSQNLPDEKVQLIGNISEVLKSNPYSHKYYLELKSLNSKPTKGKVLVNFSKKNLENPLKVGQQILVNCQIKSLIKPNNPNQFDYGKFLEKKDVFHQIYLENHNFRVIGLEKNITFQINQIRMGIVSAFEQNKIDPESLSILKALLLGQRQDLEQTTIQEYSMAGAIHILAISGLHIGILLFFFKTILNPISRFKNGKIIQLLLLISLLWLYAVVAGMSPSVVRAVTMFSFVGIGLYLRRYTSIYNTLASSILLILLFKPNFLFDVGFQLSYSAVFAIVSIQPLFVKLWKPQNKIIGYFYDILTVSFAAQIGVLPLSIYYFHQFPGLFFLTNLVIIPMLTVILIGGIIAVIFSFFGWIPMIITELLSRIILFMNGYVSWIASFENFVLKDIPFNFYLLFGTFILSVGFYLWFKKPNAKRLQFALFSLLVFQLCYIGSKYYHIQSDEIIIFQYPKRTIIAEKRSNKIRLMTSDTLINSNYVIKNYLNGNFGSIESIDSLKNVYVFGNQRVLIIDQKNIYAIGKNPDLVLLIQSPKINFERMLSDIKPKTVIADGSNYPSLAEEWEKICFKKKIPFHSTNEKGFYKILTD
jgi:competence protein ComEC